MNKFWNVSRLQLLVVSALLVATVAVACGSDDDSLVASGGDGEETQRIRMVESTQIFTEDDIKGIGWKGQRDFVLEYPGTTVAKWGFLNSKEVGVLIYSSTDDANTLGVTAATEQTFRRAEDNQAPDEGIDRISCRDAAGQSAVKAIGGASPKAFSASYLSPESDEDSQIIARTCSNRFPTYNDYTVIGNVVFMCEGDGRNLLDPSTNCAKIEEWLTGS
ncbi:MAG: hypothetical protein CL731_05685 [Chloroflexi bacterium]|nr:hypothetical protein [Chloroflexota bacterium]|tara:strand:- start:870 stop:1526 length:657 start_codon:yes stop_codon:yes gene_type:complete